MKSREEIQAIINSEVSFIDKCYLNNAFKGLKLLSFLRGISAFANDREYLIASEIINNIIKEKEW